MTVYEAEQTDMRDKTYYTLNMFPKDGGSGKEYPNIFWRKGNAMRQMQREIAKGIYRCVILRRNEVWLRNANNEYSISSGIEKWGETMV